MKQVLFTGTGTALVTPFKADKSIDYEAFKNLIDYQIQSRCEAIIVSGSTGEGATLSAEEKLELFRVAVDKAEGKIPVVAGTGSNDTLQTIEFSKKAKDCGVDALLIVAPPYNKPSQEGLFQHFKMVADAVDLPQIIYNVPGRAAINILPETQLRIAEECENVYATKEASGDLDQMMEIIRNAPENFILYSGDDSLTQSVISVGGKGVISVLSNYAAKAFSEMVRYALAGDFETSKGIHYSLFELMNLNFVESNPAPVKAALTLMGLIENNLRMPLLPASQETSDKFEIELKKIGLIK